MTTSIESYDEIEITTDVMSASHHRLIQLMLNKGLQQLELAKYGIAHNDMTLKLSAINKAQNITDYLQLCLNRDDEKTKELASKLDDCYTFILQALGNANKQHNALFIEQAKKVMLNLKEGWDGINP